MSMDSGGDAIQKLFNLCQFRLKISGFYDIMKNIQRVLCGLPFGSLLLS